VYHAGCRAGLDQVVVHTGQHYDTLLSSGFFDDLEIPPPDFNLEVGSATHAVQTARIMERFEPVLTSSRPDWLVVYGDVNSTMAATIVASKLGVRVAHVEAGLRSFNRRMPEEINRVVADHLSAWLFCPTQVAVDNLAAEGLTRGVEKVGDVMYDGMLHYRARAKEAALAQAGVERGRYVLATVHRAENTDDPARLRAVFDALALAAAALGRVVLALHPRTRARLIEQAIEVPPGVHVIDPAP